MQHAEFSPQCTLAERIRAGGAGIPALFTGTDVGIVEGKPEQVFDGKPYIIRQGLFADLAILHAWRGDTEGNLVYRLTARNLNPMMATAAHLTLAEVEELIPANELDGDHVVMLGIFVQHMAHVPADEKRPEQRTTRKHLQKA